MRKLHCYQQDRVRRVERGPVVPSKKEWQFKCKRFVESAEELALIYPDERIEGTVSEWTRTICQTAEFPVIVSAGHYIPKLSELDHFPPGAQKTAALGFLMMQNLSLDGKVDFLLYINDIHFPALPKNSKVQNPHREALYSPYIPPLAIRELMEANNVNTIFYEGEKSNYNSFVAYIRRRVNSLDNVTRIEGKSSSQYIINANGREMLLFDSPDSKCKGACAYLFKLLAENGYKSCVFVYPTCSIENLNTALDVSSSLFGIRFSGEKTDMTVYMVFLNHSCFG